MADLQGAVGEVSFTIQVTRKDTGVVEEYKAVGFVNEEQLEQLKAEGFVVAQPEE